MALLGGADNFGSFQLDAYRELIACQKANRPFHCYVNPAQPDQAILYRDLRWEMMVVQLIFVLMFGSVGFGLLFGGLAAVKKSRAEAALAAAHPEARWMWKADWAAGQIVSSQKNAMRATLLFAVFWIVVTAPLLLVLPGEILTKHNRVALLGLTFPAIGLLLAGWAVYAVLRWRKFGQSIFQMASVPGVVGGQLAGVIRTSAKIRPEDGFHLLLRCVRRVTTGAGKSRHTTETVAWEDERIAMHELLDDLAEQSAIPVAFDIPYDCQPSDERNADDQIVWRLTAAAEVPGIDYTATFEVPIFKTADSDPHFSPQRGAMDQYVGLPTPERELREAGMIKTASPDGVGVRFLFPMGRNPGWATIPTVLALVFVCATVILFSAVRRSQFRSSWACSALLLFSAVNLYFYQIRRRRFPSRAGLLRRAVRPGLRGGSKRPISRRSRPAWGRPWARTPTTTLSPQIATESG